MQVDFYRELINKLEDYKSALKNVGFAAYELSRIKIPKDEMLSVTFHDTKNAVFL